MGITSIAIGTALHRNLRIALKVLKRRYGLRVVTIRQS
jgi:hypothetical protein